MTLPQAPLSRAPTNFMGRTSWQNTFTIQTAFTIYRSSLKLRPHLLRKDEMVSGLITTPFEDDHENMYLLDLLITCSHDAHHINNACIDLKMWAEHNWSLHPWRSAVWGWRDARLKLLKARQEGVRGAIFCNAGSKLRLHRYKYLWLSGRTVSLESHTLMNS